MPFPIYKYVGFPRLNLLYLHHILSVLFVVSKVLLPLLVCIFCFVWKVLFVFFAKHFVNIWIFYVSSIFSHICPYFLAALHSRNACSMVCTISLQCGKQLSSLIFMSKRLLLFITIILCNIWYCTYFGKRPSILHIEINKFSILWRVIFSFNSNSHLFHTSVIILKLKFISRLYVFKHPFIFQPILKSMYGMYDWRFYILRLIFKFVISCLLVF